MKNFRNGIIALAFAASAVIGASAPAMAQEYTVTTNNTWQPGWDHGQFDRHHVIVGRVKGFSAYRLWLRRRDGQVMQIDLRNGTVIRPLGATPQRGQHVAVVGYYRNGTFIAKRVILR